LQGQTLPYSLRDVVVGQRLQVGQKESWADRVLNEQSRTNNYGYNIRTLGLLSN